MQYFSRVFEMLVSTRLKGSESVTCLVYDIKIQLASVKDQATKML